MKIELYQASYNISLSYLKDHLVESISRDLLSDLIQWLVHANFMKLEEEVVLGMKNALVDSEKVIFPGGIFFKNWWRDVDEKYFYYGDDGLAYFNIKKYFKDDK